MVAMDLVVTDFIGRLAAKHLADRLGQRVSWTIDPNRQGLRSRRNFFWLRAAATNELPLSGIRLRLSVSLFLLEVSQAYALRALNAGCIDGDRSLSSFGPMDCLGQYQTKVRPKEKSRPKQVIWWKQHSSALIAPLRPSTPLIGSLTIMVERRLASLEGRVGNRKNVMADHSYRQGADLASNR